MSNQRRVYHSILREHLAPVVVPAKTLLSQLL
jgi:hypothetical protein